MSLGGWKMQDQRYNSPMSPNAQKILEEALKLPARERRWIAETLLTEGAEESFAAWQKKAGEPEPGYEEWFRKGVEEAMADTSGDIPHDEAMKQFHQSIRRARKLKESA